MNIIIKWYSDQFSKVISFGGSSESPSSAKVTLSGKFEFGGSVIISQTLLDIEAYKRLETFTVDTGNNTPSGSLPIGNLIFNTRFALSEDYDLGTKYGGLSLEKPGQTGVSIKNTILGTEFRMQMLKRKSGGFDLTGSLALNKVDGFINLISSETISSGAANFEGVDYYQVMVSSMSQKTNWNFCSFSLRAVASTDISFFTPIIGLQVDVNSGATGGEFNSYGTVYLTEIAHSTNTQQGVLNMTGTGTSSLPQVNMRLIAGFELNFNTVAVAFATETAGNNFSGMLNVKIKF